MDNKKCFCHKCKHKWSKRGKRRPKYCPSCHSPNWEEFDSKNFVSLIIGDT